MFSATFIVTLVVGLLFSLIAFSAAGPIARFLVSGDGVLTTYTRDYIRISMLGAPVIGIGLMMVNYLGVENHPELASVYLIAANVINLVLDYIFLRFTPLWSHRCILINCSWFPVCHGGFPFLYSLR